MGSVHLASRRQWPEHSEQSLKYPRLRLIVLREIADAGTAHTGRRTHFSRKALHIQWQSRNVTD